MFKWQFLEKLIPGARSRRTRCKNVMFLRKDKEEDDQIKWKVIFSQTKCLFFYFQQQKCIIKYICFTIISFIKNRIG